MDEPFADQPAESIPSENGATLVSPASSAVVMSPVQKLVASDGAAGDVFAHSISVWHDTAVIGAIFDDLGANTDQGSAYVFERVESTWVQKAKLVASDGGANDEAGMVVSLEENTAIVSAHRHDVGSRLEQGAAYVFVRDGGTWTQQAKLTANDGVAYDQFGADLSLSGDTVVVAAKGADIAGKTDQGAAYVFVRNGTAWSQQAKLVANDGAAGDTLARASISGDTIFLGAHYADAAGKVDQGVGYIFVRNGTTWTQQAKLVPSDAGARDLCGLAVDLHVDTAILGCRQHDIGTHSNQGAAYVFARNGGVWSQEAKLTAPDGAAEDWFGISMSVQGNLALVGATNHDVGANVNQGVVYTFQRSGSTWTSQNQFSGNDCGPNDWFGFSLELSGSRAFIGADASTIGSNTNQGSAYVYEIVTTAGNVGDACSTSGGCATGFCVDGVCCNTPCADTCMACSAVKKGSGLDGVCGAIAYDKDPDEECMGGACNGKNACQFYNGLACAFGTQCLSRYCVDGVCCNNICMGECRACSSAKKGSGYDGACGDIAATTNPDNECAGGTCNGSGACTTTQPKSSNGAACISAAQCQSGYCADGVCCDSWCLGTCETCSASIKGTGANGVCGPIAQNADPQDECFGGSCNGDGTCKRVNGTVCSLNTECASGRCVDNVCCDDICDGPCVACSAAKKGLGQNGICASITSGNDPDNECTPGECNGSGACNQAQTLLANGSACVTSLQCASSSCVDGVCCDVPCTDTCMACTATKKGSGLDGVCGAIAYDKDPDQECAGGACNGKNACQFYNGAVCTFATQCLSNYCVDGVCCNNICLGECMACSNAKKGGGYDGVCGVIPDNTNPDAECSGGTCNGSGACSTPQAKVVNGAACVSAAQCQSGYCADGVCCDSWCLGTCVACKASIKGSGVDGVCGPIAQGTDPENDCISGSCNGDGTCKGTNGAICSTNTDCLSGHCVDQVCCASVCDGFCEACSTIKKGMGQNGVCEPVASGRDIDNECDPCECNGSGACNQPQPLHANGAPCLNDGACVSGFCVDSFCCDVPCFGTCQACAAAKTGGTSGECRAIPAAADPDDECTPSCNGAGGCFDAPNPCADFCTAKAMFSGVAADRCLDIAGGAATNGANVQSAICGQTNAQKWFLTAAGELRSAVAFDVCLEVEDGATANGSNVRIGACNGTTAQRWTRTTTGELRSMLGANLCLDVEGASSASRANVQIWECNQSIGQQWFEKPALPNANPIWPGTLAITINDVHFNGGSNVLLGATPGQTIQVAVDYTIVQDTTCPGCVDQILIGMGASALGCVYNGGPSPAGTTGTGYVNITAPTTKGVHYLRWHYGQDVGCAFVWWSVWFVPSDPQNIGVLVVQ
ncbi:MAG TPA: ricin-type beta-trefoil lectin domain protein [Polyangium sp.]|nr:ricin-type beta-trefoil lectin domain protein [Polyangium sp.]